MCTDVDRNDKSRVCVPGSVRVIGRRQIEMYSRLIHTVDHIEGRLRPGLDALDAFLTHMWAVTVTGAPKTWAMQFIEDHEGGPRRWYGGAVGMIGFDGGMNTGLTLRTAHITRRGRRGPGGRDAAVRLRPGGRGAGDRAEGARAAGDAGRGGSRPSCWRAAPPAADPPGPTLPGQGLRVLLVDHQDSFVHTLAGYFREQGAEVPRCAPGCPPRRWTSTRRTWSCCRPGRAGRPTSAARAAGRAGRARAARVRGVPGPAGDGGARGRRAGLLAEPAHGKPGQVRADRRRAAAGCWPGCRPSSPRPGTTRCTRCRSRSRAGSR